jgi:8-oxo-dGTP diphosphatase
LRVVAAAIIRDRRVLLVSKLEAPHVFYLPGGKPEAREEPLEALGRELAEELGVTVVDAKPLRVVTDEAALEPTTMEMHVYLVRIEGAITPQGEISRIAWVDGSGEGPGSLAPEIRNQVLRLLVARQLISAVSGGDSGLHPEPPARVGAS